VSGDRGATARKAAITVCRPSVICRSEGTILIEVVVAVVLLGVLVGPLVGEALSAVGRADKVRQQAARVADTVPGEGALEAWSWGTQVAAAWWRSGPTLYVRPGTSGGLPATIGLWADGWFLGEEYPEADGVLRLGATTWSTCAGRELVVRARTAGGVWGPPRRSLVPEASGVVALPLSAGTPGGLAAEASGQVVAHAPSAGNPAFQLSWDPVGTAPGPLGMPLVVQGVPSGPAEVSLDASDQSWSMEPERDLDAYF
jgi:hypothetical protein